MDVRVAIHNIIMGLERHLSLKFKNRENAHAVLHKNLYF